ncbi:hypothetical protein [Pectobacterium cacticida]|uniref:hypothetical protein n=1 Tax=Pectobacterium cacticida TaxID=69221 RepID=UPI003986703E
MAFDGSRDITLTPAQIGALTDAQAAQKYALRSIKINGKPLSADVNLLAGDINAWNKTEADGRYLGKGATAAAASKLATARKINGVAFDGTKDITLTPENLGFMEIVETGSGTGYYWRKYFGGIIEIFANVDVIIGENKDVVFPVKTTTVIFIVTGEIGGYAGPNAYTARVSNVTNAGFSVHWDHFNNNGVGNTIKLYYHVIANVV